ncbi:MAG: inositol-3-phosphate synthase [Candidatus Aenigmatarchaeota archaeon]|nr:MAG: inositol-3-phosphate synthase [Candidatus Aenigmarchaeota archaeon]
MIRIAIAGIGNCCSALIQGIFSNQPGMGLPLKPYKIKPVAAFDIDSRKIGKDLSEAIFSPPNCTYRFAEVPKLDVTVKPGPRFDGVAEHMLTYPEELTFKPAEEEADVAEELKRAKADVLINFLPVGAEKASRYYAEAALEAGCAFLNCIPVFIASDPEWAKRFERAGLPIIGDDVKSQLGATIVHRTLARLFEERGVRLERSYQLNVGGNTDFLNMLERSRLKSKKKSKTQAVESVLNHPAELQIGPSDWVPWLKDRKIAFIRLEGRNFGGAPLNLELRLEVWDSPNSAGVVIEAIKCLKLALERGEAGVLEAPSAYFMKSPPKQYPDWQARKLLEEWICR